MAVNAGWVPDEIDEKTPSSARVYDYLLGGEHNFDADRVMGAKFSEALPGAPIAARLNRAFLRRAVLFMAEQGIRQFLDIGSGIPTVGNVHDAAQGVDPSARVAYVDRDPVAVNHSRALLADNENAIAIREDLRDTDAILENPEVRELLDFDRPVGLLMVGVFHFIAPADEPAELIRTYRDRLVPGGFVALSHFTADSRPEEMAAMVEVMTKSSDPIYPRGREEFTSFFEGLELVEPGVVATPNWRPNGPDPDADGPVREQIYAGVGHKS